MDEPPFGVREGKKCLEGGGGWVRQGKKIEQERKSECESSKELKSLEHMLFDAEGCVASPTGVLESVGGSVLTPHP